LQIHGSLGTTHEMPFVNYLVESFVLGLADGPTQGHKVRRARPSLKGYQPAPALFPSEHLLRLREAAEAKVADRLKGIPRAGLPAPPPPRGAARGAPPPGARSSGRPPAMRSSWGSGSGRRRLCFTISAHVATDLNRARAVNQARSGISPP